MTANPTPPGPNGPGLLADCRPHAAAPMAVEHGVDDARRAVAVFERRKRRPAGRRRIAVGDYAIHVAKHVAEGVGPRFLVSARQVRVRARGGTEERWILRQHLVRRLAAS